MPEGKILSPAEQKKKTVRTCRILTLIFFLLCLLAPVGLLVLSFTTINSVTLLSDGKNILNGNGEIKDDPCEMNGFKLHHPLRFKFEKETEALSCTWPLLNNILRLVLGFVSVALAVVSCLFSFPLRGPLLYLFGILTVLAGVGFGYIGYSDSTLISDSISWCKDGMAQVPWTSKPSNISCEYTPFILTAVVDFLTGVMCICFALFSICFVCRADPVIKGKRKKDSLLSADNDRDEEEHVDPFEKLSRQGKKDPRDTFGETPDEPEPKNKRKGGKKTSSSRSGGVNFEEESASRFAPMSKTDREASDKPLGTADVSSSSKSGGKNVGNALFNFDDMPSEEDQKQQQKAASQPQPQPQPQPQQQQPKQPQQQPKPQQAQPKPQQGGMIDFESLAGADNGDPFA